MQSNSNDKKIQSEKQVLDIGAAHWDSLPYAIALEIKRFLETVKDSNTNIDSGHGLLSINGVPIEGQSEADMYVTTGGIEFYITVRKSNEQLLKEGIAKEQIEII